MVKRLNRKDEEGSLFMMGSSQADQAYEILKGLKSVLLTSIHLQQ